MNKLLDTQRIRGAHRRFWVIAGALGLAACATPIDVPSAHFGEAVAANSATQTVDPMASTRDLQTGGIDGMRAARAIDDFRKADTEAQSQRLVIDLAD